MNNSLHSNYEILYADLCIISMVIVSTDVYTCVIFKAMCVSCIIGIYRISQRVLLG